MHRTHSVGSDHMPECGSPPPAVRDVSIGRIPWSETSGQDVHRDLSPVRRRHEPAPPPTLVETEPLSTTLHSTSLRRRQLHAYISPFAPNACRAAFATSIHNHPSRQHRFRWQPQRLRRSARESISCHRASIRLIESRVFEDRRPHRYGWSRSGIPPMRGAAPHNGPAVDNVGQRHLDFMMAESAAVGDTAPMREENSLLILWISSCSRSVRG